MSVAVPQAGSTVLAANEGGKDGGSLQVLPETFEELKRPFAVGVVGADGVHRVVSSGMLPAAVAASAAIPCIFTPVSIPGAAASGAAASGACVLPARKLLARSGPQGRACACVQFHRSPWVIYQLIEFTQFFHNLSSFPNILV